MPLTFGTRRATCIDIAPETAKAAAALSTTELAAFDTLDLVYRSLCALMYNYVPLSGHPGGSISSGHFVAGILFDAMDYDVARPDREDADLISYAAGHKALGLYAMWALRDEVLRIAAADLLPPDRRHRLRLEDLLGFRRNPTHGTPLFTRLGAKALDGHPTPATPFLRLATGASGVGVASSLGLAFGALDAYAGDAPRVHIVEGEGGMTPGRVAEALAAAGTLPIGNAVLHVDWNQASIDSDRVCRDGATPGDYVQWDPAELLYLHDWNVVRVPDGLDFQQVIAAQRAATSIANGQPTGIVYRTTKGWRYGIEGRVSHGAGHKLCSEGFYLAAEPLFRESGMTLPHCEASATNCNAGSDPVKVEECFWEALTVVRRTLERHRSEVDLLARRLRQAQERLDRRARRLRADAPRVEAIYSAAGAEGEVPADLQLKPGSVTTLRGELGRALGYWNRASGGALLVASADLLGSTSMNSAAEGFPTGFFNSRTNPKARLLSIGGICEDAMAGILGGISTFGRHIGVGSSYGAFLAALGHIPARLHAIGAQARQATFGDPYRPFVLVCAHAGLATGEDGPTHADPQPLQLLQENFPAGTMITLTPWDPQEVWTLFRAALAARPAVVAPFVTRPNQKVLDRSALGLAPPSAAATGVYRLRTARGKADATVVLQESAVTYAFVEEALPLLVKEGIDLDVYYVASAELFDRLPAAERERIFPAAVAGEAFGITGFTLPTMYRWVTSAEARARILHPFRKGHFLGSGPGDKVLLEAGLDGASQSAALRAWIKERNPRKAEAP
jgi:transketolase